MQQPAAAAAWLRPQLLAAHALTCVTASASTTTSHITNDSVPGLVASSAAHTTTRGGVLGAHQEGPAVTTRREPTNKGGTITTRCKQAGSGDEPTGTAIAQAATATSTDSDSVGGGVADRDVVGKGQATTCTGSKG